MANLAQIKIDDEARQATPQEGLIWNNYQAEYNKLTATTRGLVSTSYVAAALQDGLHKIGSPVKTWDNSDTRWINGYLAEYNTIGRLIAGCDSRKYWANFSGGDVMILAPPKMPKDQYQDDIYKAIVDDDLGFWPLVIVAVGLGVVLITQAIVVVKGLEYLAKRRDDEYRKRVLQADLEMAKRPKVERDAWQALKKQSADMIETANKDHKESWFQSLLSGPVGGFAGGIAVILGLLIVYSIVRKR